MNKKNLKGIKSVGEVYTAAVVASGSINILVDLASLPFVENRGEVAVRIAKHTAYTAVAGVVLTYAYITHKQEDKIKELEKEIETLKAQPEEQPKEAGEEA